IPSTSSSISDRRFGVSPSAGSWKSGVTSGCGDIRPFRRRDAGRAGPNPIARCLIQPAGYGIVPGMTYIDAALLNLVELCCRRFQMLTGRTNVWLAIQLTNLSIVVYFLWAVLYFLIADFQSRVFVALFCTGLLY